MHYIEITGQPCAGKSTYLNKRVSDKQAFFLKHRNIKKFFYIIFGLFFLGFSRSKVLFFWSMNENGPIYFRMNIFFNAVSKFGIFFYLQSSSNLSQQDILVDEGLAHLPFLFLNSDTVKVIDFISPELQKTNVHYLTVSDLTLIEQRLIIRGHKRLKFVLLSSFVARMHEIEINLLRYYPNLCNQFKTFEDVTSF